jgi:HEAT repeat protein
VPWNPWPGAPKAEPVAAKDFPAVLAELKKPPDKARLLALAARLAETAPTEGQKKKHQAVTELEDKKAPQEELEAARAGDDRGQVAHALDALLREKDGPSKQAAVLALQKWGTRENVPALVALLEEGQEFGIVDLRVSAARALAAIGDKGGIPAVAHRLTDTGWDLRRGIIQILVSFGKDAEPAVWPYLEPRYKEGRFERPTSPDTRHAAIQVLEQVGTPESIGRLEKQAPPLDGPAKKAIAAIEKRHKKG